MPGRTAISRTSLPSRGSPCWSCASPSPFWWGKTAAASPLCWRPWPWPWGSIQKGAPGTSPFPPGTPTLGCTTICGCTGAPTAPRTGFSSGRRAFTIPPQRWKNSPKGASLRLRRSFTGTTAASLCTTSPTGRAFSAWFTTGSGERASTCWTSRRPPSPPPGS